MQAGALVSAVAVVARAAVLAGFGIALVDVMLAVVSREARRAQTREGVDAVHAGAAVEAGAAEKKSFGEKVGNSLAFSSTQAFLTLGMEGEMPPCVFAGVRNLHVKMNKCWL